MPSIFTHAIVGWGLAQSYRPQPAPPVREFAIAAAVAATVPDLDILGIPGIELAPAWFGHRGITHSFAFALLLGFVAVWFYLARRWQRPPQPRLALFFAAVIASHPLLDALTNGGPGIRLFLPFSTEGYFFPWRPILVSPIGTHFFSVRGLHTLASEMFWVWLPTFVAVLAVYWRRRRRRS